MVDKSKEPAQTRVYGKRHNFEGFSNGTNCVVCGTNFYSLQGDRVDSGCYGVPDPMRDIPIPDHSMFRSPPFP